MGAQEFYKDIRVNLLMSHYSVLDQDACTRSTVRKHRVKVWSHTRLFLGLLASTHLI